VRGALSNERPYCDPFPQWYFPTMSEIRLRRDFYGLFGEWLRLSAMTLSKMTMAL
jgi:hypothetical protein